MKKIPELDALRGLAAVGVVFFHVYPTIFFLGWSCVDLFFVLSGFLISSMIIDHVYDRGFFSTFYYRRALRIWPVYYLTLLAVLVINASSSHGFSTAGLGWHLLFLQNIQRYWHSPVPPFITPFSLPSWTVAIEEQFYLVWPMALWFVGPRGVIPLAGGLIAVSLFARQLGLDDHILVGRFDGLALGSILAALWRTVLKSEKDHLASVQTLTRGLVAVGVVAFCTVCLIYVRLWPNVKAPPVLFSAVSVLYFAVVGLAVCWSGRRITWPLRIKLLRWLGSISYAIYMFHYPILTYAPAILEHFGIRSFRAHAVLESIAIFALPTLSYWTIEKPVLSLKERFRYERALS